MSSSLGTVLVRDRTHSEQLIWEGTHSEQLILDGTHSEQLIWDGTHSELFVDLGSDEGAHDAQVFLEFSDDHRMLEIPVGVCPEHHLLILRQELPHPSTHLSEEDRQTMHSQYTQHQCFNAQYQSMFQIET